MKRTTMEMAMLMEIMVIIGAAICMGVEMNMGVMIMMGLPVMMIGVMALVVGGGHYVYGGSDNGRDGAGDGKRRII